MIQQQQRQLDSGLYELRFYVPGELVGLAIGRDGNNVNEVRRMEGIAMVEFDDYSSMFRVRAEVNLLVITRTQLLSRKFAGVYMYVHSNIVIKVMTK